MTRTVSGRAAGAKSDRFPIRNQNCRIRNQISPVMQKVRDLLPSAKAAFQLAILTDQPLSNCQKMLSGARPENPEMLAALLRSEMGEQVLEALMGEARPEWFVRHQKNRAVAAARRVLRDLERSAEQ